MSAIKMRQEHPNIMLVVSYLSNLGVWMMNVSIALKLVLAVIAGATTIMAFMNQYKTFIKNYGTTWVVVAVKRVTSGIKPRRTHHRGVSISRTKKAKTK